MTELKIKIQHSLGDQVYFKIDTENTPYIVTGYILRPGPSVVYLISDCGIEAEAYGIELSNEKNI